MRCGNDIRNGSLDQHLYQSHKEENIESYIELLQEKVEGLENSIIKERRNSKLNVIHDERIIKQSGPKLTNINEEQMEE